MKAKYLLYFCDGIGSVFDSQVIVLLKSIIERKYFKEVYLFLGIRDESQRNNILERRVPSEIKIVFFKTYPNYPVFNFMVRKSIKNALLSMNINFDDAIFHTRGEMIAWHLSRVLDKKYIKNITPDVRGASVEEVGEFYSVNRFSKFLKILNNTKAIKQLNKYCRISVVSNSLMEYLITNYNIDSEKLFITPCLSGESFRYNESKRDLIRNEFNLSDDDILIVFSSGGTANWQNNDVIIKLAEKGLKVLNLSKKEVDHKNIINKFVSYSEMPSYLCAADVAIIWRDNSIVNKVASPVKFSEYVCCGLPVIANHTVDMISEYITKNDSGLLIDNLDMIDINAMNNLKQKDRKKISVDGIRNFGIEIIVNKYLQTLSGV